MKLLKVLLSWMFIAAILVLSTGCDEQTDTDIDEHGNKPASECATISICFPPVPKPGAAPFSSGDPANIGSIREMLDELNIRTIQELNTKIELVWLMNDPKNTYEEQLLEILGSDNAPDAFCGMTEKLIDEGLAMDITELFPETAPAYYTMLNEWGNTIDTYKHDGKLYKIPSNTVAIPMRYCVIAREDLVERYLPQGLSDIDDYCVFLSAVKQNEGDAIIPGAFCAEEFIEASMQGSDYYHITANVVGRWTDDGIDPMLEYETDEFIAACGAYKDLRDNRIFGNVKNTKNAINNGKLASVLCDMTWIRYEYPWFSSISKYRIYPLDMDSYSFAIPSSGGTVGINSNSKNADRVMKFITWLQSDQENYDLFMYGIKDRHYKLSGDYLELADIKDVKPIAGWEGSEAFMNYFFARPYPYEPEDYLDFRRECASKNIITQEELCDMKGYEYDSESLAAYGSDIREAVCEYEGDLKLIQHNFIGICIENPDFIGGASLDADKTMKQIIDDLGLQDGCEKVLEHYKARLGSRRCDFYFSRYHPYMEYSLFGVGILTGESL